MISTIRYFIDERAQRQPNTVYMIAPEARLTLTYGQLQEDSLTFGKHLLKLGLQKGDKLSLIHI